MHFKLDSQVPSDLDASVEAHDTRPIRILTISTLFPNPEQPAHGIFVASRLEKLLMSGQASAEVIAPVPWLPSFIKYPGVDNLKLIPQKRRFGDILVHHPRYVVIPKVGMSISPFSLYLTLKRTIEKLLSEGRQFDLIDAHYFYPDGVAAALAGRHFGVPVVITARGTDLSLIPKYLLPRKMIQWAAKHARGLITVCQALKDRLIALGISGERVSVVRNGVDLEKFKPLDRNEMRNILGLRRKTLASVGLLIERKGHHLVIEALASMPDTDLLIAGEGPDRDKLEKYALAIGVAERVRFLGRLDQPALERLYNAADALVLASSREGWANVLLEAMACGTPVIASNVWGTPEVVSSPAAGVLMPSLDANGVIAGAKKLFDSYPVHELTREYAEQYSWDETTSGQLAMFRRILAESYPNRSR